MELRENCTIGDIDELGERNSEEGGRGQTQPSSVEHIIEILALKRTEEESNYYRPEGLVK